MRPKEADGMANRTDCQTAPSLIWPRGYKTFFMLNSVEHKFYMLISVRISRNLAFLGSGKDRLLFFQLINVKMPTIVGILTLMSRKKFMLS